MKVLAGWIIVTGIINWVFLAIAQAAHQFGYGEVTPDQNTLWVLYSIQMALGGILWQLSTKNGIKRHTEGSR